MNEKNEKTGNNMSPSSPSSHHPQEWLYQPQQFSLCGAGQRPALHNENCLSESGLSAYNNPCEH